MAPRLAQARQRTCWCQNNAVPSLQNTASFSFFSLNIFPTQGETKNPWPWPTPKCFALLPLKCKPFNKTLRMTSAAVFWNSTVASKWSSTCLSWCFGDCTVLLPTRLPVLSPSPVAFCIFCHVFFEWLARYCTLGIVLVPLSPYQVYLCSILFLSPFSFLVKYCVRWGLHPLATDRLPSTAHWNTCPK